MTARQNVLVFTKGTAINPATRYRFLQYLPYLESHGFNVETLPLFPDAYYGLPKIESKYKRIALKAGITIPSFIRRLADLPKVRKADLVVIENQLFPYEQGFLETLLSVFKKKTIIEFDDAIYLTRFHRSKLLKTLKKIDRVIVGNSNLASFASLSNKNVSVVPTVIDMDRYAKPDMSEKRVITDKSPLVIGWVGLPSTLPYLREIHGALKQIAAEFPVELRIICSTSIEMEGVPTKFVQWSEQQEAIELTKLDVGVMPLNDDEWARGKCGAKLLQYMAASRLAIASPVGVNSEIVDHMRDGLLASSEKDWYSLLKMVCENPEMITSCGLAARKKVEQEYSLQVWAPRVAAIYRDVING